MTCDFCLAVLDGEHFLTSHIFSSSFQGSPPAHQADRGPGIRSDSCGAVDAREAIVGSAVQSVRTGAQDRAAYGDTARRRVVCRAV